MRFFSRSRSSEQSPKTESKMKRLTFNPARNRQSKLERDKLEELEKATHFDKKELQQWYKGVLASSPSPIFLSPTNRFERRRRQQLPVSAAPMRRCATQRKRSLCRLLASHCFCVSEPRSNRDILQNRLPQGLPLRHAHQGRVPEDLRAVLPLWRPIVICRLRIQRVRHGQVRHH